MQTKLRCKPMWRPILCVAVCTAGIATTVVADAPSTSPDARPKVREHSLADMVRMAFPLRRGEGAGQGSAMIFVNLYKSEKDVPKIAGAYVDAEQEKLIVVGPAEAEAYIRGLRAMLEVEMAGIPGDSSLKTQKLGLVDEYRELLEIITELELVQVDVDSDSAEKSAVIADRIAAFSAELEKVKRKLEIVERRQREWDEFERSIGSRADSPNE